MEQGWASKKQKQPFCKTAGRIELLRLSTCRYMNVSVSLFSHKFGASSQSAPYPLAQGNGVFCATWYLNCSLCLVRLSPLLTGLLELTHLC